MNYDNIRTILDTQTKTVTSLPLMSAENVRTNIAGIKDSFVRTTLLPAEPTPLSVSSGGANQYTGLFQIDLFYKTDYGTSDSNSLSSLLQAAFPRGTILTDTNGVRVQIEMCWQQTAYTVQKTWYVVPVIVRWAAYQ